MLKLKAFTIVVIVLHLVCLGMARKRGTPYVPVVSRTTPEPSEETCGGSGDNGRSTYSLCNDFRGIRDLISANNLVYIISKHYKTDAKFRRAMEFIHTDEFASVSQQIAESQVYQQALQEFSDAGVDTSSIANISSIVNCLLLSMPEYGDDTDGKIIVPRTLQSFAMEIMNAIPRDEFSTFISNKLADSKNFAQFYRIVRSSSFRSEMLKGFNSYQLSYPLSVLKRNCIDLRKLASIAMKIFSWGPAV